MKKPGWPFKKGHFLFYKPVGGINIKASIAEMFGSLPAQSLKYFINKNIQYLNSY